MGFSLFSLKGFLSDFTQRYFAIWGVQRGGNEGESGESAERSWRRPTRTESYPQFHCLCQMEPKISFDGVTATSEEDLLPTAAHTAQPCGTPGALGDGGEAMIEHGRKRCVTLMASSFSMHRCIGSKHGKQVSSISEEFGGTERPPRILEYAHESFSTAPSTVARSGSSSSIPQSEIGRAHV